MSNSVLPSSSLSLSAIQTEFGGSNPISLNEYYKQTNSGGIVVPPFANLSGSIPTSGQISMSSFLGASQGVEFGSTTFQLFPVGSDPYYRVEANLNNGSFLSTPINIGAGLTLIYCSSYQDEAGGGVSSQFFFVGNVTSSTAIIVNHLNGRSINFGSIPAAQKFYDSGQNYTSINLAHGYGPGGVIASSEWPNDGVTTLGFLGPPTTWNMTGQVPPNALGNLNITYFKVYLRAY